ncbi:TPA: hypothetical protein R5S02_004094 [Salmonella enterica]|nr:hypothetical protein [Salmonella enterica]
MKYIPNDSGELTLGDAAANNISHDTELCWNSRQQIPAWVPERSRESITQANSTATTIDWGRFIFTAGCSYAISKESTNNPLADKGVDSEACWVVTCLSNSYLTTSVSSAFLIVREANRKGIEKAYMLCRYVLSGNNCSWTVGEIPMTKV